MGKAVCRLTVFFDDPFWIGIFEKNEDGNLTVSKHTFGTEPKDREVYDFILNCYSSLEFSPAVETVAKEYHKNPKRLQRELRNLVKATGTGTKSQQALKLQQEQNKQERKVKSRAQKQAEAERMFELKQQKKKEKHRGR